MLFLPVSVFLFPYHLFDSVKWVTFSVAVFSNIRICTPHDHHQITDCVLSYRCKCPLCWSVSCHHNVPLVSQPITNNVFRLPPPIIGTAKAAGKFNAEAPAVLHSKVIFYIHYRSHLWTENGGEEVDGAFATNNCKAFHLFLLEVLSVLCSTVMGTKFIRYWDDSMCLFMLYVYWCSICQSPEVSSDNPLVFHLAWNSNF